MFAKVMISGTVETVTGLHIGGSGAFSAIGAVDSPVVKDSRTGRPMIPGSSLKGKMRALLAKKYNEGWIAETPDDDAECLTNLFGSAKKGKVSRILFSDMFLENTDELKNAVNGILSSTEKFHYLYGTTGSGKTEVFLSAAEKIMESGKGVIYLVPEIGLTPQVVKAVQKRFGSTVAVLHSALTPSQRLGEWKRILSREARIVVGARSAVFAPVPQLGLIIIDEEHDSSYKSGSSPRYHARQIAMLRCKKNSIPLVMGSATPSVESWHSMQNGTIIRHTLTKRLAGGEKPQISCVNLSLEADKESCISKPLQNEIQTALSEKKQTILFLNRRGFTHFFRCSSCGYELKCKNCSVSMTYHKSENRLRCHYCGYSLPPPQQCPKCVHAEHCGYSPYRSRRFLWHCHGEQDAGQVRAKWSDRCEK